MMILIPIVGSLAASPWVTVLLTGALAVAVFALVATWMYLDPRGTWM
jgi:hypothetical protein